MRKILVRLKDESYSQESVYNLQDFPFQTLHKTEICRTKKRSYYNIPAAFDLETTNVDGKKNEKGEYITRPFAFMYHWQFCLDRFVIFGRTWEEFTDFMDILTEECLHTLCVYVHNLAFEYQFIKDFIPISNLFARSKRRPMKFDSHGGKIEWRCSYFLSNMSLSMFCKNSEGVTHYKLTDTYDYKKMRTYLTKMSPDEEGYCFNDVYGLCECIRAALKEDTIATIPLTSTGYVRRECREAMAKNPENRLIFKKLALNEETLALCMEAFRGGDTHASRKFAGKIVENVDSYDKTSAYPSACELDYFPMSKFTKVKIESDEDFFSSIEKYCCLFRVNFFGLKCHEDQPAPYIPLAKCNKFSKIVNDNGRILQADFINITLTELDFLIIEDSYDYEDFSIEVFYIAKRGKLPKELREIIFKYFEGKTSLKDIEGLEYEYAKFKNKINAIFGMMVTSIISPEIVTDGHEWKEEKVNTQAAILKYYTSHKSFLSYQWGVWTTAHVRHKIHFMRNKIKEKHIYNDTDSLKGKELDPEIFEKENREIRKKCEENDIPLFAYNRKGEKCYMDVWEHDAHYLRFKTLGAKKYVYDTRNKKTGKVEFHVTISGVNKKKGAKAIGSIERFEVAQFGKALGTLEDIGRSVSHYNEEDKHKIAVDGATFTTASNVAIIDTTYKLGITDAYYEVLKNYFDISTILY